MIFFIYPIADQLGQVYQLLATGPPVVYQYQGLMLVDPGIPKSFPLKTALFYEPSCRDLVFMGRYFIKGGGWICADKFIEFFLVQYRVFKKTSTVAQFFWIGQFTLSNSDNGIGNIPDTRVRNALQL